MNTVHTWCCKDPDVMESDRVDHENALFVDRVCLRCYTHWYGAVGVVKKYTQIEWTARLDSKVKELIA